MRAGRGAAPRSAARASMTMPHPAASSIAPSPRSHESRCAPRRTISSGLSRPAISPITLADSRVRNPSPQPSVKRTRTGPPRRHEPREQLGVGDRRAPPRGSSARPPRIACRRCGGDRSWSVPIERMRTPTAPSAAPRRRAVRAHAAPRRRSPTRPSVRLIGRSKKTIFPRTAASPRASELLERGDARGPRPRGPSRASRRCRRAPSARAAAARARRPRRSRRRAPRREPSPSPRGRWRSPGPSERSTPQATPARSPGRSRAGAARRVGQARRDPVGRPRAREDLRRAASSAGPRTVSGRAAGSARRRKRRPPSTAARTMRAAERNSVLRMAWRSATSSA